MLRHSICAAMILAISTTIASGQGFFDRVQQGIQRGTQEVQQTVQQRVQQVQRSITGQTPGTPQPVTSSNSVPSDSAAKNLPSPQFGGGGQFAIVPGNENVVTLPPAQTQPIRPNPTYPQYVSNPQPIYQPISSQPVYSQPTYSQPTYSQPTYGQPVYSQPIQGQPIYSQPTYGQPSYSQPVYGQPVYSQPVHVQPAYVQPTYVQPTYQRPSCVNHR